MRRRAAAIRDCEVDNLGLGTDHDIRGIVGLNSSVGAAR
jgi:hypothetical protein